MNIGFDAKRVYQNSTGLGHYSRTLIASLLKYCPANKYFLFAPKITNRFSATGFSNIQSIEPSGILSKKFRSLWRSYWILNDLKQNNIELYHGLSHEIPRGIHSTNIKSVVTIHDLIFEIFPQQYKAIDRFIYRKKFRHACRYTDHIIAISQQTKKDIIELYGIDEQKITVCYQSCDERYALLLNNNQKEFIRKRYALPEKYFLYVGSIIERKNLLGICKAIKQNRDNKIPLVVIGDGKSYKQKVKTYLQENNIITHVIFLSETAAAKEYASYKNSEDFPAIYQMATAFIYPSIYEGFGIPILEALWSGTPVITTSLSCMPETAGDAAWYVPAGDADALSKAMLGIANNNNIAEEMKLKGWKHAEKFTQKKTAAAVMEVYNKTMHGTRH
ncbi:MAG: glycosyltransferase family 1 protein [Ferruginibacter sp.]